jgi:hypothetical protein
MTEIKHERAAEDRIAADSPERVRRRLLVNRCLGIAFGVVGPLYCLDMSAEMGVRVFGQYTLAAHFLIGTEMVLLLAWLVRPARSPWIAAAFAGAFALGATFAFVVGLLLAPVSVAMLAAGIGFLGLVPLGTAYTFGRVSRDAYDLARAEAGPRRGWAFWSGFVLAVAPMFAGDGSNRMALRIVLQELRSAEPQAIDSAQRTLDAIPWFDDDWLVSSWEAEPDEELRARISELHRRRSGSTIEELMDLRAD